MSVVKKPGAATAAAVIELISSISSMVFSAVLLPIGSMQLSSANFGRIYPWILHIVQNMAGFGIGALGVIGARLLIAGWKRGPAVSQRWVLGISMLFAFVILKLAIAKAKGMEFIFSMDLIMLMTLAAYALVPSGIVFYLLSKKHVKNYFEDRPE